ncbi:MAG TPA: universal stress protein [Pyrinomonadaceae bacterium]|nr:universal stress protein [Pyrinomonadaceae bacterium]
MSEETKMRVLIGYNGTDFAKAAIEDLSRAGMPEHADALVLTVAELCFPTVKPDEAENVAAEGAARISEIFPKWTVTAQTSKGAPIREILAAADLFHPDVIVLGEPNKPNGVNNAFLGPVSQGILTDGSTALRITRQREEIHVGPPRLIVGFDGSDGAELAINAIATRFWPKGTSVRLLSIDDTGVLGTIGRLSPQMRAAAVGAGFASRWAETLASHALKQLSEAGLDASVEVRSGHPQNALIEAADEWNADTIFVGPHVPGNSFERFLLGSVSASVAAHANCTVEIVRKP